MNPTTIIKQYSNGRTIKWLADEYEVTQHAIREILRQKREDEKVYMKEMQEIAKTLPRHDDYEADSKWEKAGVRF